MCLLRRRIRQYQIAAAARANSPRRGDTVKEGALVDAHLSKVKKANCSGNILIKFFFKLISKRSNGKFKLSLQYRSRRTRPWRRCRFWRRSCRRIWASFSTRNIQIELTTTTLQIWLKLFLLLLFSYFLYIIMFHSKSPNKHTHPYVIIIWNKKNDKHTHHPDG